MKLSAFLQLKSEDIAMRMQAEGKKVVVCPINGTRRWFILEHSGSLKKENENAYIQVLLGKYMEIFHLFYRHGVDTILTPIFGPDLFARGEEYLDIAVQGMKDLVTDERFREFVRAHQIRVRFYGDYERRFRGTRFEFLLDLFAELTADTLPHTRYRLFWGVVGHDATEQVAEIGGKFFAQEKRYPTRKEIIEAYYGEYVDPVAFYVGFDQFSAFDMPLLALGKEDLYFTTSPTPYLTERQLRIILFDHLFSRKGELDYSGLSPEVWARMRHFYHTNRENTLGVGINLQGIWYPLAQVDGLESLLITEVS